MSTTGPNKDTLKNGKWVSLEKAVLADKVRGDRIYISECAPHIEPEFCFEDFRSRIQTYFKRKGISLIAVPNEGYDLATAEDQVFKVARTHQRKRLNQSKKSLWAMGHAPEEYLSETNRLRRIRLIERDASVHARLIEEEKQTNRELGKAPEPPPSVRLAATSTPVEPGTPPAPSPDVRVEEEREPVNPGVPPEAAPR